MQLTPENIIEMVILPWARAHNRDIDVAKFKLNQKIFSIRDNKEHIVIGVCVTDEDKSGYVIEYAVTDCDYLLWEYEMTPIIEEEINDSLPK